MLSLVGVAGYGRRWVTDSPKALRLIETDSSFLKPLSNEMRATARRRWNRASMRSGTLPGGRAQETTTTRDIGSHAREAQHPKI